MKTVSRIGVFCGTLALGLALVVSGCRQPLDFVSLLDGATGAPLVLSPTTASVLFDEELTLQATGGSPPYVFSIHGDSADLGSIDPETGVFRAPAKEVTVTARATDANENTVDAHIEVRMPDGYTVVSVSPSSASSVTGNTVTFTVSGGTPPYTATVASGESGATVPTVDPADPSKWLYTAGSAAGEDVIEFRDSASPQNSVSVTVLVTTPDLVVDYEVASVSHVSGTAGGGTVDGEFSIRNAGVAAGTSSVSYTAYASTDDLLSFGDTELESGTTVALSAGASSGPIPFSGTLPQYSGNYYLLIVLSSSEDSVVGNNFGATTTTFAVTGDASPDIDYTVSSISAADPVPGAGTTIGESFVISNIGTADGSETVHWSVYVSSNATYEFGDAIVASGSTGSLLAGGDTSVIQIAGTWPQTAGTYYLVVQVSAGDEAAGTGSNDVVVSPSSFAVQPPDVDYQVVTSGANTAPTVLEQISETFSIENVGADAGAHRVYWTVYMSLVDDILDASDAVVDAGSIAPLAGTASSTAIPIDAQWPDAAGASYHLIFTLSAVDDVYDVNDVYPNTDQGAAPAFVLQPLDIEYQVDAFSPPTGSATGESAFSGTFQVTNTGADTGSESVYWTAYLSTDGDLTDGTGDWQFDGGTLSPPASGVGTGAIAFDGQWPSSSGDYYVVVYVTAADELDPVTGNTATSAAVTVTGIQPTVDYAVTSVTHTAGTTGGGTFTGEFTFGNVGTHGGAEPVDWKVVISTDSMAGYDDVTAQSGSTTGMLPGDPDATEFFSGMWPEADGTYYLIPVLTAADDSNGANNVAATGSIAVTGTPAPDVDYVVHSLTATGTPTVAGSSITEQLVVRNQGTADGTDLFTWAAYYSKDDSTLDAIERDNNLLDAGQLSGLPSGSDSGIISVNGSWPDGSGTYYLIVELTSSEDSAAGNDSNNSGFSGGFDVQPPDVNYDVTAISAPVTAVEPATAASASFEFDNIGVNDGSSSVYWNAYVSTKSYLDGSTEAPFDSGSVDGLPGSSTSGAISMDGTWPSVPNTYYLIVVLSASEDNDSSNNAGTGAAFQVVSPAVVDYIAGGLSLSQTLAPIDSTATEEFYIENIGDADGAENIQWTAYLSSDTALDPVALGGTDVWLDSGSRAPLTAGSMHASVYISGTWAASVSGDYYVIVEVSAGDDGATSNDVFVSDAKIELYHPPDYELIGPTLTEDPVEYGGYVGQLLSDTTPTPAPSEYTFSIAKSTGDRGKTLVTYGAVYSNDGTVSLDDITIVEKTVDPFDTGGEPPAENFDSTLPTTPGQYYIILYVSAEDDRSESNNYIVGGPMDVASGDGSWVFSESDYTDDSAVTADDFYMRLNEAETMTVNGILDDIISDIPSDDYFVVRTGHDVTKLSIYSEWTTPNEDCMDLGVYNTNLELIAASADLDTGREPQGAATFDVEVTPNTTYYILAQTWAFQADYSGRDPYSLFVTGGTWP